MSCEELCEAWGGNSSSFEYDVKAMFPFLLIYFFGPAYHAFTSLYMTKHQPNLTDVTSVTKSQPNITRLAKSQPSLT
jgi:homogentisate 1,2-dioxygenase